MINSGSLQNVLSDCFYSGVRMIAGMIAWLYLSFVITG